MSKPQARFELGQKVRVLVGPKNTTPHEGTIRDVAWHHKDRRYNHYLLEGGKKVSSGTSKKTWCRSNRRSGSNGAQAT